MYNENESLRMRDEIIINDNNTISIVNGHSSSKLIGELLMEGKDIFGNTLFKQKEYNDILIGGSTFILEQMFKPTTRNHALFNMTKEGDPSVTLVGVPPNLGSEKIFGFVVGNGGEVSGGIKTVNYVDRTIPSWLPIRVVSSFTAADKIKYKLRTSDGKRCYAKTFTDPPTINHKMIDGSALPAELAVTDQVVTYAEVICELDTVEIREGFADLSNCGINSLGLISGYPIPPTLPDTIETTDYSDIRLVTTVNFKTRLLDNNLNTLKITYRVYCI